ncbi:MAG: sel1 repeat family protein [Lachnospiraceae bacterium]|nr:sel1 repeat family protein [Lachnospiraceae bacterium]
MMNDWKNFNEKGNECFNNKKFLDAIQWYKKGLEITSEVSTLYYNIGNSYLNIVEIHKKDEIKAAIVYLSKACKMGHSSANYCLAKIYDPKINIPHTTKIKNTDLALMHYKESVYEEGTHSVYSACNNIAVIYGEKKQYIEALCWSYYAKKTNESPIFSQNHNIYLKKFKEEIKEEIIESLKLINNITDVEILINAMKETASEDELFEKDIDVHAIVAKPKEDSSARIAIGVFMVVISFIISGRVVSIVGVIGVILIVAGMYSFIKINEIEDSYYNDRQKFDKIMGAYKKEKKDKLKKLEEEKRIAIESQKSSVPWEVRYMLEPCKYCGHYKVRYAKWEDKSLSVAFWGIASGKIGKNYKCEYCGKMW